MFQWSKCLNLKIQSRYKSILSKVEAKERRNLLFDDEKKKQINKIGRIEKIQVKYENPVEEVTLVMNKHLSTPADCAKHISEGVSKVSALALVNGKVWDMHKPLHSDCNLKLLNLLSPKNNAVNTAFWRTCSFILGAVIDASFKSNVKTHLHSFPVPIIKSGSFIYDVHLELDNWKPNNQEMLAISALYVRFINEELIIERLQTTESIALEMFSDNPIKSEQIPLIAKKNENIITLYRIGTHIDISNGPMIGNSSLIGRCTIAAAHKIGEHLYRFQGIAIPKGVMLNQYAFGILENRAKVLNGTAWSFTSEEKNENNFAEQSATS